MKDLLKRISERLMREKGALWVCSQVKLHLKKQKISSLIWPICFIKGNLTLGTKDSFLISYFKAQEKNFLANINKKISPLKINKIFYRISTVSPILQSIWRRE